METFDREQLVKFIRYVMQNDMQILANRREARNYYNAAIYDGLTTVDPVYFGREKADKLATFMELHETQAQNSATQVNVYAFVRLMGELRRMALPSLAQSAGASGSSTPPRPSGAPASPSEGGR